MPEIGAAHQIHTRPLPMPDTPFPLLKKKRAHQNNQHTRGITNIKLAFDIHFSTSVDTGGTIMNIKHAVLSHPGLNASEQNNHGTLESFSRIFLA
jgi:hypothetical protein